MVCIGMWEVLNGACVDHIIAVYVGSVIIIRLMSVGLMSVY